MAAALSLCACSEDWPPPGRGGAAELHTPILVADPKHPADPAQYRRLDCALARYAALRQLAGALGQRTGEVALEGVTAVEAQREFAADMRCDADRSIERLDGAVSATADALGQPGGIPPACT